MSRIRQTIISASKFKLDGFSYYQTRTFASILFTYLLFYLCRYNLAPALAKLHGNYGISDQALDMLPTVFMLTYIVGQFVNGFLADRYDPKVMVIVGGIGSAACNVAFAMSGSYWWFLFYWMLNAYCSSMAWSACCRILFHWFPVELWGHVMGLFIAVLFAGPPMAEGLSILSLSVWNWQSAFVVPAFILFLGACVFSATSENQPHDRGYAPEWDMRRAEIPDDTLTFSHYINLFTDAKLSLACLVSMGSSFIRWGLVVRMVELLNTPVDEGGMGFSLAISGAMSLSLYWVGIVFALLLGMASDRFSKGVRWPTITAAFFVSSAALGSMVLSEWLLNVPVGATHAFIALVIASGLIQGVQVPMFCMAGAIAPKRLRGTAIGIMDGWNYVSTMMAIVVLGKIFLIFGPLGALSVMAGGSFLCGVLILLIAV